MGRKKKIDESKLTKEEIQELEQQKVAKRKAHDLKIATKQQARLSEHIARIKRKEEKGPAHNKERFYVTNAKLLEELNKWKDSAKNVDERVIPEEFGKMILMIAQRLSNHSNFKNYPRELKEDMVSYGCFKCIQGLKNYNFEFKNAFAYFTTACYNAFVSTVTKYYKQININRELTKKAIEKLESTNSINSSKILNKYVQEFLEEIGESNSDDEKPDTEELA